MPGRDLLSRLSILDTLDIFSLLTTEVAIPTIPIVAHDRSELPTLNSKYYQGCWWAEYPYYRSYIWFILEWMPALCRYYSYDNGGALVGNVSTPLIFKQITAPGLLLIHGTYQWRMLMDFQRTAIDSLWLDTLLSLFIAQWNNRDNKMQFSLNKSRPGPCTNSALMNLLSCANNTLFSLIASLLYTF